MTEDSFISICISMLVYPFLLHSKIKFLTSFPSAFLAAQAVFPLINTESFVQNQLLSS